MPSYAFRIRVNLMSGDRIDIDAASVELSRADGAIVELRAVETGRPINAHPRVSIVGCPYTTREQAQAAAAFFRERLLAWATRRRLALDMGDSLQRSWFTPAGLAELERRHGRPVRMDVHGVDVFEYEEDKRVAFAHFGVTNQLTVGGDTFVAGLKASLADPQPFSPKEALAAELYASARFDASFRSRFLTLVCGLEALLVPAPRAAAVQELVVEFQGRVKALEVDAETKKSLGSSLEWLKAESIGQAGRRLAQGLHGKRYLDKEPAAFWSYVYDVRSKLVHQTSTEGLQLDFLGLSNAATDFLGDLLDCAIELRTGRSSETTTTYRSVAGQAMPGPATTVTPSTEYLPPRRP
jgi:hypothetical protein